MFFSFRFGRFSVGVIAASVPRSGPCRLAGAALSAFQCSVRVPVRGVGVQSGVQAVPRLQGAFHLSAGYAGNLPQ